MLTLTCFICMIIIISTGLEVVVAVLTGMEDVEEFLEAHKDHLKLEESVLKELIECLDFIGVSKLRDLKHVERGNLQVKGISTILSLLTLYQP